MTVALLLTYNHKCVSRKLMQLKVPYSDTMSRGRETSTPEFGCLNKTLPRALQARETHTRNPRRKDSRVARPIILCAPARPSVTYASLKVTEHPTLSRRREPSTPNLPLSIRRRPKHRREPRDSPPKKSVGARSPSACKYRGN